MHGVPGNGCLGAARGSVLQLRWTWMVALTRPRPHSAQRGTASPARAGQQGHRPRLRRGTSQQPRPGASPGPWTGLPASGRTPRLWQEQCAEWYSQPVAVSVRYGEENHPDNKHTAKNRPASHPAGRRAERWLVGLSSRLGLVVAAPVRRSDGTSSRSMASEPWQQHGAGVLTLRERKYPFEGEAWFLSSRCL